ncbi:Helix-turn-helix domain-containing protein [Sinosporangium album]|uniref:Helix-turn-helix domain-containing protein n=1 Tax=Sinosporangium album TaxID=504805 RepID=A0A1G8HWY4_9ACTN|nr:helix-turn-helix transcriptional regulator [Sinosporangium album]SDI11225.1 Helix-turn-helix domain-containing protein [Sinosporangium album]
MTEQADAAKKAFGVRLRNIRKDAGMHAKQLAEMLQCHPAKVTRIELGQSNASEDDIRSWAIACGVARLIPELIATRREIALMWEEHRQAMRAGQPYIQARGNSLYEKTKLLKVYESGVIPGILQTRGYVYGVMEANARLYSLPTDDLAEATEARLSRQHLVINGSNTYAFVLEAGALNASMGNTEAMHEQFDFLARVARLPNVALGIIPPARRRILYPGECFYIFDDQLVRDDLWTGRIRTTRPDEIAIYLRAFEMLHSMAVYGSPARALIEEARSRLPQSGAIP